MAQYDGSIRINTEINMKNAKAQLMALENQMVKTADKITSLRSKMDSLKDAKIPTQAYKDIESDIAKAEKEMQKLIEKQAQMQREGKDSGAAWDTFNQKIQATKDYIDYAKEEMQQLVDSGKAFTLGSNTQEYANLGQQLRYAENEMDVLNQKHEAQSLKVQKAENEYKRLGSAAGNSLKRIASIIKNSAITSMQMLGNVTKKVGSSIKGIVANLLRIGKSSKSASVGLSSMNMGFKNILKYGLGIRSLYVLVNKFRTAVKEGFQNLAQYSKPVNASLSSLKSAVTQLKNSLATAFTPILTAVAPALTALINMASKAATAVGMLVAALTGQKSFVKAAAVQEDYAASLKKTGSAAKKAAKSLVAFDKLTVLNKKESDDSGNGGGGVSPSDMFETVDIPSKISNLADMIKKAWEKADFTEIGKTIGKKLKKALDKIPWSSIKAKVKKVGKSFATLINGFVEVKGFGYTIGNTIAQAINTGLTGINEFAKNLHWDSVGKFIGDGVNGVLKNINWKTALSAAKKLGSGIATAINSFIKETDFKTVGKTVANFLNTAIQFALSFGETLDFKNIGNKMADGINGFFKNIKPKKFAETINTWVKGALKTASTMLKKTDLKKIGEKIGTFLSNLDLKGVAKELGKVLWEAIKSAFKLLVGLFKSAPLETFLLAAFALLKFTGLGKTIASNIASSIKKSIESSSFLTSLKSGLKNVVGSAVVVFSEFEVVSDAFKELTSGTGNFVTEIGKITGAATLAAGALKLIGLSNPFTALLTSAGLLAGAIWGVWTASSELDKQLAEEQEIEKYGQTWESLKGEIEENSVAIRDRIKASEEYIKSSGTGEVGLLQTLSDEYFKLYGKQDLTNDEIERMKSLSEKLIEKMPELSQYYNEQSGLLETTKKNVDALIQSRLNEIKLNAIEEQLTQAYKDQATALDDVEKAATPVNDATKTMKELQEDLQKAYDRMELQQKYDDLFTAIENGNGDVEKLKEEMQLVGDELQKKYGGYASMQELQADIDEANVAINDFTPRYKEVMETFGEAKEAYDAVEANVSKLTKMYTDGMTDAAESGVEGYTNGIKNYSDQVEDSNTKLAIKAYEAFNKGQDAHSPSKKFEQSGKYSVDGYVQGITKNKKSAIDAVKTLVKNVLGVFDTAKDDFLPKGKEIVSGIESGISEKWTGFISDWTLKKDSIVNKFSDIKSLMKNVGKNIINGIISGIKSLWSKLSEWAQKIIDMFSIEVKSSNGGGTTVSSGASTASVHNSSAMEKFDFASIPKLANGAVIRGGDPFMAVLGDQPRGQTNIEAPLDTIRRANKAAVLEALSELGVTAGSSRNYGNEKFVFQVDGKTFFEITRKEAQVFHNRTGRPAFPI